jgi:hypothetical protein
MLPHQLTMQLEEMQFLRIRTLRQHTEWASLNETEMMLDLPPQALSITIGSSSLGTL